MISRNARQNGGIACAQADSIIVARSISEPLRRPASTPSGIASSSANAIAARPSLAVAGKCWPSSSATGRLKYRLSPKSPRTTPVSQRPYCTRMGSSKPCCSDRRAASAALPSPARRAAGLPDANTSEKLISDTNTTSKAATSKRRNRNAIMGQPLSVGAGARRPADMPKHPGQDWRSAPARPASRISSRWPCRNAGTRRRRPRSSGPWPARR
ncbi:hypothetical protein D3C86_1300320 [compost metagenome]